MTSTSQSLTPASPTSPPALRRLLARLRLRTQLGVFSQALCLSAGVGVLAWGLAAGLFRWDAAPLVAIPPALATAAFWLRRQWPQSEPLPVLARAEQHLHLHELWTTAWTLDPAVRDPAATNPALPSVAAVDAQLSTSEQLIGQVRTRAEVAAQTASATRLLPVRLPAQWSLALVLAFIGVAVGLRPQNDEAAWSIPGSAAGQPADPSSGGGAAARTPPIDPQAVPPKPGDPATRVQKLTPAEIAAHQADLEALIKKIDTPEKLRAAREKLAEFQRQTTLPEDRVKAFEAQLKTREKALAQNPSASHPGAGPTDPPGVDPLPAPGGDPAYQPVALLNPDRTLNPAILHEAEQKYPEYTGALTRYVQWLAEHGKP